MAVLCKLVIGDTLFCAQRPQPIVKGTPDFGGNVCVVVRLSKQIGNGDIKVIGYL